MNKGKKNFKITAVRRVTQLLVLIMIIVIPALSQNMYEWSPSEVVMGRLPPPSVFPVTGDTWAFSAGPVNILHPVAFIESVISARNVYIPALIAVAAPLVLTLLFGRVFCSWFCPVGFILEFVAKLDAKKKIIPRPVNFKRWDFRYVFAGVLFLLTFFLSMTIISVFDPPHALGREMVYLFTHHHLSIAGAGLLIIVLIIDIFLVRRGWCRYFCPSGGCLSLLGKWKLLRLRLKEDKCLDCGVCSQACQFGLNPAGLKYDSSAFNWTICDNCGLCADKCPGNSIGFIMRG